MNGARASDRGEAGIRRASSREATALATLWLLARRAAIPAIPPPVHDDDDVHRWFSQVVLRDQEVWVIGPEAEPVAMIVLDDGWVEQLYVSPDRVGRGHGSRLLRFAQSRQDALELWTFASNVRARAFYEHHGFVALEVSSDNEEGAPAVRYRWSASAPGGPAAETAGPAAETAGP